jgi:UDP-N-acetylmuramate dehydrogenase
VSAVADVIQGNPELKRHEPMARHTSWRVGGPADLYFEPASVDALGRYLAELEPSVPVTWIGLGSNLLVRDGGIRGVVIATGALPKEFDLLGDGRVHASAALPCATLAKRCARAGLGPAAFFAGIPGSLGGALAMNAGAFGGESWDRVVSVETIDRRGRIRERARAEYAIAYRSVHRPAEGRAEGRAEGQAESRAQEWFIGATLALSPLGPQEAERIRALLRQRSDKQPLGLPSAGSVFRNPEGAFAGELIERAGLKGFRVGGAIVAEKHANFIINTGDATAADIESLIAEVQRRVRESAGVLLEPEVRVIGEAGMPS